MYIDSVEIYVGFGLPDLSVHIFCRICVILELNGSSMSGLLQFFF